MSHRSSRVLQRPAAIERAVAATVEPLEVRRMLSTVVDRDSSGDNDNLPDIFITGTSGTDRITIYLDPADNYAAVFDDRNGNGQVNSNEFTSGPMPETFDVSTLGGTDTVNVRLLSDLRGFLEVNTNNVVNAPGTKQVAGPGDYYNEGLSIYVDLGSGNDKFEISSPTDPLPSSVFNAIRNDTSIDFDVDADPSGADIIEGGDLVVQVEGGTEKDTINFDFSRTSVICSSLIATADAGAGDDLVNLTLPDYTGDGYGDTSNIQEAIAGCVLSSPDIEVDLAELPIPIGGAVSPSNVSVAVDLGSGRNTMNIHTNTIVSASDVHIDIDGGKDTDIINDYESILTTSYVVEIDNPASGFQSNVAGRYVVDIELGSGNDTYNQIADFSNLERTAPTLKAFFIDYDGQVTYNVRGDSGKDTILVKDLDNGGTADENTAEIRGILEYNLWGGTEDDSVSFDTDPGSQFALEGGELKVLVSGDGGNDFCRIDVALVDNRLMAAGAVGGLADPAILTILGGSGNDKLGMMVAIVNDIYTTAAPVTKGAVLIPPNGFFGPTGSPLLDGGAGSDRYDLEGNVFIRTRGAETNDESIEPTYIPYF